jgi:hypothetical protein
VPCTLDLEFFPSVHGLKGTDNWAFPYTALTIVLKLKTNLALAMRRFSLGSFATTLVQRAQFNLHKFDRVKFGLSPFVT